MGGYLTYFIFELDCTMPLDNLIKAILYISPEPGEQEKILPEDPKDDYKIQRGCTLEDLKEIYHNDKEQDHYIL